MDFGLLAVTQYEIDRDLRRIGDELVTQTQLANESGFDLISIGEHHFTDSHQYLLNESALAHIAQHVEDTRLVASLILLPYHNPARIAELGATLDILSDGQFTMGVGLGYRQKEYDVFGVERDDAVGRFRECVEIIKRLWTEEYVSYDGDYFQLDEVAIRPQPLQDPRPPIWTGASNESSVRRGARKTDGFLGAHVPFDLAQRQIEDFRDERETQGLDEGEVGLIREAYVAETREKAEEIVREPLMGKYESYSDWGQDDVIGGDDFDSPWDKLKHERFLVGSPEDVRADIERYKEAMDLDYLFIRTQFPGADFDDVHSSIELFGEEVIPSFK
jgi:alkanesulfonate monooxygenase SsuD/methylene tetrahydromethanopterin reductase-like flavin-dependent oxidoreductase (luciferase family)